MDEKFMLKAALATTALGLIALALILKYSEVEDSSIFESKQMEEDSTIKLKGIAEQVTVKGNLTLITLSKKESILVVAFENLSIEKGTNIQVIGRVKEYQGRPEVLAESIIIGD